MAGASQLSCGKDSSGSPQPIQIGDHGDQFPHPKDYLDGSDTTYTAPTGEFVKYVYGHGASGATITADIEGIGTVTGIEVIGLWPTRANSITWTAGGDATVY